MEYRLVEVFAAAPGSGATVAVFPDARGVDAAGMQRIAGALGAPTAAFVQRPRRDDCDHRLRVFAPRKELPLSAQASFAAAALLCGGEHVAFEENVTRSVLVRTATPDGRDGFRMPLARPVLGAIALEDRALVADALGITTDDLAPGLPVVTGSCGVNLLLVPVASTEALLRAALHPSAWQRTIEKARLVGAMLFVPTAEGAVRARCLASPVGVLEDTGHGLGCATVAVWMVRHGVRAPAPNARVEFEVGAEAGRIARLHVEIEGRGDADNAVRVLGHAREFARGALVDAT